MAKIILCLGLHFSCGFTSVCTWTQEKLALHHSSAIIYINYSSFWWGWWARTQTLHLGKKICLGIILYQKEDMFWKWGMHVNPEYASHRILLDIAVYLSEKVKYLILEELAFIIVSMADSKLPSYRQGISCLKLLTLISLWWNSIFT